MIGESRVRAETEISAPPKPVIDSSFKEKMKGRLF
jgi:hypothetical protein